MEQIPMYQYKMHWEVMMALHGAIESSDGVDGWYCTPIALVGRRIQMQVWWREGEWLKPIGLTTMRMSLDESVLYESLLSICQFVENERRRLPDLANLISEMTDSMSLSDSRWFTCHDEHLFLFCMYLLGMRIKNGEYPTQAAANVITDLTTAGISSGIQAFMDTNIQVIDRLFLR
jgi:hypothetical protein